MKLSIAADPNGGIGYKNRLPWIKLQGDLPRFKYLTDNQTVIMGRNTWDSLPIKPLYNRHNIVVSSQTFTMPEKSECITYAALIKNMSSFDDAWLIGGAQLVNACWDYVTEVYLSKTFAQYDCDKFIDLLYLTDHYYILDSDVFPDHEYQIWKRK